MTRRSEKTTFAALIAVCALGALYPVATAVAHRTESSAHALKPGGVEADAVVTVLKTGVRIAPAQLQAGRATFYIVNKTGALQSVVIDGPGLARPRTAKVASGGSTTLKVKLTKGAYKLVIATGTAPHPTRMITVHEASVAPVDNGSTNQPPDHWWDQCQNI
jgi:hypothetical protein